MTGSHMTVIVPSSGQHEVSRGVNLEWNGSQIILGPHQLVDLFRRQMLLYDGVLEERVA